MASYSWSFENKEKTTSSIGEGDTTGASQPKSGMNMSAIGGAIGAIGEIAGGINALSTGKMNAKLSERYGKQAFTGIMQEMKQRVSGFEVSQGATGVRGAGADVSRAGAYSGIRDATREKLKYDMQAVNQRYEGRMGMSKALMGAGQSLLSVR